MRFKDKMAMDLGKSLRSYPLTKSIEGIMSRNLF